MLKNTFTNLKKVCTVTLLPRIWRGHIIKCGPGKFHKLPSVLASTGSNSSNTDDKERDKCKRIIDYTFGAGEYPVSDIRDFVTLDSELSQIGAPQMHDKPNPNTASKKPTSESVLHTDDKPRNTDEAPEILQTTTEKLQQILTVKMAKQQQRAVAYAAEKDDTKLNKEREKETPVKVEKQHAKCSDDWNKKPRRRRRSKLACSSKYAGRQGVINIVKVSKAKHANEGEKKTDEMLLKDIEQYGVTEIPKASLKNAYLEMHVEKLRNSHNEKKCDIFANSIEPSQPPSIPDVLDIKQSHTLDTAQLEPKTQATSTPLARADSTKSKAYTSGSSALTSHMNESIFQMKRRSEFGDAQTVSHGKSPATTSFVHMDSTKMQADKKKDADDIDSKFSPKKSIIKTPEQLNDFPAYNSDSGTRPTLREHLLNANKKNLGPPLPLIKPLTPKTPQVSPSQVLESAGNKMQSERLQKSDYDGNFASKQAMKQESTIILSQPSDSKLDKKVSQSLLRSDTPEKSDKSQEAVVHVKSDMKGESLTKRTPRGRESRTVFVDTTPRFADSENYGYDYGVYSERPSREETLYSPTYSKPVPVHPVVRSAANTVSVLNSSGETPSKGDTKAHEPLKTETVLNERLSKPKSEVEKKKKGKLVSVDHLPRPLSPMDYPPRPRVRSYVKKHIASENKTNRHIKSIEKRNIERKQQQQVSAVKQKTDSKVTTPSQRSDYVSDMNMSPSVMRSSPRDNRYNPERSNPSQDGVLHMENMQAQIFATSQQNEAASHQNNPTFHQNNPTFHQNNPVFHQSNAVFHQNDGTFQQNDAAFGYMESYMQEQSPVQKQERPPPKMKLESALIDTTPQLKEPQPTDNRDSEETSYDYDYGNNFPSNFGQSVDPYYSTSYFKPVHPYLSSAANMTNTLLKSEGDPQEPVTSATMLSEHKPPQKPGQSIPKYIYDICNKGPKEAALKPSKKLPLASDIISVQRAVTPADDPTSPLVLHREPPKQQVDREESKEAYILDPNVDNRYHIQNPESSWPNYYQQMQMQQYMYAEEQYTQRMAQNWARYYESLHQYQAQKAEENLANYNKQSEQVSDPLHVVTQDAANIDTQKEEQIEGTEDEQHYVLGPAVNLVNYKEKVQPKVPDSNPSETATKNWANVITQKKIEIEEDDDEQQISNQHHIQEPVQNVVNNNPDVEEEKAPQKLGDGEENTQPQQLPNYNPIQSVTQNWANYNLPMNQWHSMPQHCWNNVHINPHLSWYQIPQWLQAQHQWEETKWTQQPQSQSEGIPTATDSSETANQKNQQQPPDNKGKDETPPAMPPHFHTTSSQQLDIKPLPEGHETIPKVFDAKTSQTKPLKKITYTPPSETIKKTHERQGKAVKPTADNPPDGTLNMQDSRSIQDCYLAPSGEKIQINIPASVGPLPVFGTEQDLPLSVLLKTIQLKNRLESYRAFIDSLQAESLAEMSKCPPSPPPCPPKAPKCPKKIECPPPKKVKCPPAKKASPCPPKPQCPPPCPPPPKCPPAPKNPCAKCIGTDDFSLSLRDIIPHRCDLRPLSGIFLTIKDYELSKGTQISVDMSKSPELREDDMDATESVTCASDMEEEPDAAADLRKRLLVFPKGGRNKRVFPTSHETLDVEM